ncbi:hypothetical protein EBR25_13360 [bacterium]|nr:hypothetical protein [bacterium]
MGGWLETQKKLDKARAEMVKLTGNSMAAADKTVRLAVYGVTGSHKGVDELDNSQVAALVLRMFTEGGQ